MFHRLCSARIPRNAKILEIGAGPENKTSAHLASIGTTVGVDISGEIQLNRSVSSAVVYDGQRLPFDDASFDCCVSNYVIEHIKNPESHFREVARVLRPGGRYCFRTPNLWHYVALSSRLLPHAIQKRLANPLRALDSSAHEPYPTQYRANTRHSLSRLCGQSALDIETILMIEAEPSYGRCHPLVFFPMMIYERLVNVWSALQIFRANIFAVVVKRYTDQNSLNRGRAKVMSYC
ncbi:MAG: class I SAM-dependent methyltransferase [Bryobacteraceae bacterium]